jgi:hypothetical protein
MFKTSLLLTTLILAAPTASAQTVPAWMAGYWLSCANGEQVSETWTAGGDMLLLGVGITRAQDGVRFEVMRVAKGSTGAISLYSSPEGAPPTEFALKSQGADRAVFENAAHDFPQRIIYARDGQDLTARIEGKMQGRDESVDWRYAPAMLNAQCAR